MTLDLGFSAFFAPVPAHWSMASQEARDAARLQFTMVDCPGHASLIRTIMGGAQIIRTMLLVVDAQKGIQTQTAECLVIGEITAHRLIVVVNKLDLLPDDAALDKLRKKLAATFKQTKFADAPIVAVAATNPDAEAAFIAKYPAVDNVGVPRLIELLQQFAVQPRSGRSAPARRLSFRLRSRFCHQGPGHSCHWHCAARLSGAQSSR
jgi:selenocysteine-specific elongation factor